jgi:hypothetical protein
MEEVMAHMLQMLQVEEEHHNQEILDIQHRMPVLALVV